MLDNFRQVSVIWDKATKKIYQNIRVASSDYNGRKLVVQVINNGVVEDLSTVALRFYWEHKDDEGFDEFILVDASKGVFELYYSSGMLENIGEHKTWLHLTDMTGTITSEPFSVTVFGGINEEAAESDNNFTALTEALLTVQQYDGIITQNATDIDTLDADLTSHMASNMPHFAIPTTPELEGKNIEIVAGVLRQNSTDPTRWDYLGAGHVPIGVEGESAIASGTEITINFKKTYSRVISFICSPDETFARLYGFNVGASVGYSSAFLNIRGRIKLGATVRYDGTKWVYQVDEGSVGITSVSQSSANISIVHGFCPGQSISVTPYTSAGAVLPYIPVYSLTNDTATTVNFIDPITGQFMRTASNQMCMRIDKVYDGVFVLDGTNGFDTLQRSSTNIWFYGIFEV